MILFCHGLRHGAAQTLADGRRMLWRHLGVSNGTAASSEKLNQTAVRKKRKEWERCSAQTMATFALYYSHSNFCCPLNSKLVAVRTSSESNKNVRVLNTTEQNRQPQKYVLGCWGKSFEAATVNKLANSATSWSSSVYTVDPKLILLSYWTCQDFITELKNV